MSSLLDRINSPADVQALTVDELDRLAAECRQMIIATTSLTGGHLAANLGTVELTIALLRTFTPPTDKLLWDVSHQTYTYKLLTGRRALFHTLRQTDGLSGFLCKAESVYDAFGAGHAGTALSAALGMAVARDRQLGPEHIVAVVGDGALSCGSSFEALNNLSATTRRLIVVLNDNEMSIAANVGSIARYLGNLLAHPRYNRWKSSVERFAKDRLRLTWLRQIYYRMEEAIKGLFLSSVFFEEFGLRYIGPIDGHNIRSLISALETARHSDEPILLHVSTQKGKGYPFAEEEPETWHGIGAFECQTGRPLATAKTLRYSEVCGQTLTRLAQDNQRLIAITAAMASGTGLLDFAHRFPERFFDVGISEEHAVIFAAGLAAAGWQPVIAVYSTFAQRMVDYIIHDVCLQELPVILCLDRAGLVGDDGPTHHGIFDIALLRAIPHLVILQPKDEAELAHMLYTATNWRRPTVIRYPRGCGPGTALPTTFQELPFGKAELIRAGGDIQLWALGDMLPLATRVAEQLQAHALEVGIVNPRFIKPLDTELLSRQAAKARVVATIENAMANGGFGSAVSEALADMRFPGTCLRFGWPTRFIPQGTPAVSGERFGLNANAIADKIRQALATKP